MRFILPISIVIAALIIGLALLILSNNIRTSHACNDVRKTLEIVNVLTSDVDKMEESRIKLIKKCTDFLNY